MKDNEDRFWTFQGESGLNNNYYFTIFIKSDRQIYAYKAVFLYNSDSFAQRSHL